MKKNIRYLIIMLAVLVVLGGGAAVLLEIRELLRQLVRQRSRGDVRVTVIVQGNVIGNRAFADELGRTVGERVLRALDNI